MRRVNYEDFLKSKNITDKKSGFVVDLKTISPMLFDWQKVIVRWALARGRAAIFADCGLGKCVSKGTIVPTENGFLPIEDIISDEGNTPNDSKKDVLISVLTKNGIKKTSYFYKGVKQNCIKITTNMGYALSGIYRHPVLILDCDGLMKWKLLCDIKSGDYVAIQRKFSLFGNDVDLPYFNFGEYKREGQYSVFEKKKTLSILSENGGILDKNTLLIIRRELGRMVSFQAIRNWILKENIGNVTIPDLPIVLDEDFSYLLGILVGDGCLTQANVISLTSIDPFIIDFFKTQMRLIGIEVKDNGGGITYDAYSSIFKDWISSLGLHCVCSYEKQIPRIIMTSTRDNIRSFLQGLFDTDGWSLSKCGGVGFGSSSKKLAEQVHFLLLQFGIISKLSFKENDFKGSWNVSIFGIEARKFYNRIGFRLERKQDNCDKLSKKFNTNIDVIPYLPKMDWDIFNEEFKNYKFSRHCPSYDKLNEMAIFCSELNDISDYNFFWDQVVNIEDIGEQQVYDLNVPDGHNFIANGFVVHNTPLQLEWANHVCEKTKGAVLILAPLAVSEQTKREGDKFNIEVNVCRDDSDVVNGINITNYEKLHKFDTSVFSGIVLDECFASDTPIDVFNIDNFLTTKYIKDIMISDRIYNAGGFDYVCGIYKRSINRAVQIGINGRRFTCSENHPWFTMYGWRCAKDLQAGDYLMATKTAVRMVWDNFPTKILCKSSCKILRDILLCEMENEPTRNKEESTQSRSGGKEGEETLEMAQKWEPKSLEGIGEDFQFKPNVKSRNNRKNDQNKNKKWNLSTMERKKGWQWPSSFDPSTNNVRFFIWKLATGICNIFRKTSVWVSNVLQSRYRKSRSENSNRNRRSRTYKQKEENIRRKERQEVEFIKVESIEILEQGHPELEKYRDETGVVYFYDIKAKRHPSFSVNGCLVHNSSILKNFSGVRRNEIIDSFKQTPYRLACTATPAPNDYMELGNHSEYLGVMTRTEMLAMFFINDTKDTGTWRLKGHVKNNIYWKWMSSWAVMLTKPSDIGYEDGDFILPEIRYHEHLIKTTAKPRYGFFTHRAATLNDRRRVRRDTIGIRGEQATDLINSTNERWVVWCNLNDEGDYLEKNIKDIVQVAGRHSEEVKTERMTGFAIGNIKRIVTKPKIAGLGMNWQVCNKAAFVGLSDSWEQFYQAVRRIWRFGQKKEVDIHIFLEEREGAVLDNIKRKDEQARKMVENMIIYMGDLVKAQLRQTEKEMTDYLPGERMRLPEWIKS